MRDDRIAVIYRGGQPPGASATALPDSLFRHEAWLEYKAFHGWENLGEGLLLRTLRGGLSLAYMQGRGPRCPPEPEGDEYGPWLEEEALALAERLPPGCACLRLDLSLPAWLDEGGRPLSPRGQEMRMNFGSPRKRFRKAEPEPYPADTMVVDLSAEEEELRSRLAPKTRYALRLGLSRGTVVAEEGRGGLPEFCRLYAETAERKRLPSADGRAFSHLMDCAERRGLSLRLYVARDVGGRSAASAIFAQEGPAAWYLFAASSAAARAAMGPSLVLWRGILDAKRAGARVLDLLGVSPPDCPDHPLGGVTRFKAGFGGTRVRRLGAWDWVLDEEGYAELRGRELGGALASTLRSSC